MDKYTTLNKVVGSDYCSFSVVENKLARLYQNQEIIYKLLQTIHQNQIKGECCK